MYALSGGAATVPVDAQPGPYREAFQTMEDSLASSEGRWLFTAISRPIRTGRLIRRYWIPFSEKRQILQRIPDELNPGLEKAGSTLTEDLFLEIEGITAT